MRIKKQAVRSFFFYETLDNFSINLLYELEEVKNAVEVAPKSLFIYINI